MSETLQAIGSNGYTVELRDIDNENVAVVVWDTKTGVVQASVSLDWSDGEEMLLWLAEKIGYQPSRPYDGKTPICPDWEMSTGAFTIDESRGEREMSELNPSSARVGDVYRTALGLRLLPVGSVIRNKAYFLKVDDDAWAMCDTFGGAFGTGLKSEQIWLPATIVRAGDAKNEPDDRERIVETLAREWFGARGKNYWPPRDPVHRDDLLAFCRSLLDRFPHIAQGWPSP